MNSPLITEAIEALLGTSKQIPYTRISDGLINYSFYIAHPAGQRFFLQQINKTVFTQPEHIIGNLQLIYQALQDRNSAALIAKPISFLNGHSVFCDSSGEYWRAADHIASKTFHQAEYPDQIKQAVKSFADFTRTLSDLDVRLLQPTLVGFHDLSLRYDQFLVAIEQGLPERIRESEALIEALLHRENYVTLYKEISNSPQDFKQRVMHHDAKLSNLLFDQAGKKVLAIADLDTTMPGYFFSDLGDMIRSMVASCDENSGNSKKVNAIPASYEMLYQNYVLTLQDQWTRAEQSLLHSAGLLMIYMQSLRFITDHLNGDLYYQLQRPGQNKERALHQYDLLCSLEELLKGKYQFSLR
ncbi:MAG: aminoglycoside phosphotransferase family protein [Sphingomonadales bacterium]|nr:aminoglycoside phosphotransferase family protein [Sphingomonadales bacterium]